jgi:2-dehydropantoate 2-reductase
VTTDHVLDGGEREAFAKDLMREVLEAASACGVELDPRSPEWNLTGTRTMGAYRPSMLVDFELARPVEVEAIVAEPLRRGLAAGADLPAMCKLLEGIRRVVADRDSFSTQR